MLTGSQLDGTAFTDGADHTCGNYTSSATTGTAQLGHHDRTGGGNTRGTRRTPSRGCSQENLVATGGAGLFYCFAINSGADYKLALSGRTRVSAPDHNHAAGQQTTLNAETEVCRANR